jgi:hypothetical protein
MSAQKRRSETSRALRAATRGDKYGVSLELELAQLHASTGDTKRRICIRWGNRRHSAPDRNARCRINAGKGAASDSLVSLPNLTLPPFTIYTADAAKLGELPLPAPREIAYFYAQIASMQDDLTRLAKEPFLEGPAGGKTEQIRRVLNELNEALCLGDDILRELRQILSPKHQKSLTRA